MQLEQIYNALEFPRVSIMLVVIWLDVVCRDFSFLFKRHFLEASSHIAQTHHSTVGVDNPTCLISSPDYQRLRETGQPEWQDWFMWVVPLPSALGSRWACLLIGSPPNRYLSLPLLIRQYFNGAWPGTSVADCLLVTQSAVRSCPSCHSRALDRLYYYSQEKHSGRLCRRIQNPPQRGVRGWLLRWGAACCRGGKTDGRVSRCQHARVTGLCPQHITVV